MLCVASGVSNIPIPHVCAKRTNHDVLLRESFACSILSSNEMGG